MNITRIARPGRLRLIVAAVIVAMAGLVIPLSQIASARSAEAAAAGDGPKPSIVLVHGAPLSWALLRLVLILVDRGPGEQGPSLAHSARFSGGMWTFRLVRSQSRPPCRRSLLARVRRFDA